MTITIEVNNCKECPFYRANRYGYCSKKFNNDIEAYHAGEYAEYDNELDWLFENCPFSGKEE